MFPCTAPAHLSHLSPAPLCFAAIRGLSPSTVTPGLGGFQFPGVAAGHAAPTGGVLEGATTLCKNAPRAWKAAGSEVQGGDTQLRDHHQCPHPCHPPVGVEEDVDEHGGDGGQRVGRHGQDAEAVLGALHGVQRGAGGCGAQPPVTATLGDSTAVPPRGHQNPTSRWVVAPGDPNTQGDLRQPEQPRRHRVTLGTRWPLGMSPRHSPALGLRKPLLASSQVTGTDSPFSSL